MPIKPGTAKEKGNRLERAVQSALNKIPGVDARKQPGSGRYMGFPHDVFFEHPTVGKKIIECKSWKHGWRTGDNAMGRADVLVIKRDFGPAMAYLTFDDYCDLLAAASQGCGDG